jgi:putative tryptophan/tyrosine transport system substrate-binding protein
MPKTVGIMGIGPNNQDQVKALKDSLTAAYPDVTFHEGHAKDLLWVDLLIAAGGSRSALAANAARGNSDRPIIVFTSVAPYVVQQLAGVKNITGVLAHTSDREKERVRWLRRMTSKGNRIGVLRNSNRDDEATQLDDLRTEAHHHNCTIHPQDVNKPGTTIKDAFDWFKGDVHALVVAADPFFNDNRQEVVDRATAQQLPAIYQWCEFVKAGGLMSWGPCLTKLYERAGKMAASILNDPTAIPKIEEAQPEDFELCVNQATAQKLVGPLPDAIREAKPKIY